MAFYDILIPKGALTCVIPLFSAFFYGIAGVILDTIFEGSTEW